MVLRANTVVPSYNNWSLKKFFNYHKHLFIAIYYLFNFQIENYN